MIVPGWSKLATALNSSSSFNLPIESLTFTSIDQYDQYNVNWTGTPLPMLGLKEEVIYDTIITASTNPGDFTVGALSFEVSCGYLENITASLRSLGNQSISKVDTGEVDDRKYINLSWNNGSASCDFAVPTPSTYRCN
jgi:hypothetical protein